MKRYDAAKAIHRRAHEYEHVGLGASEASSRVHALVQAASERPGDDCHLLSHLRQLAPCLLMH